jgi:hypothetical protein
VRLHDRLRDASCEVDAESERERDDVVLGTVVFDCGAVPLGENVG